MVDSASAEERRLVSRVPGTARQFDVTARGSKVFINDQYASRGLVVDRDGTDRTSSTRAPATAFPGPPPERPRSTPI